MATSNIKILCVDDLLPFHAWKAQQLAATNIRYDRFWYYEEYGKYCNRKRRDPVRSRILREEGKIFEGEFS